jgi:hypothetical protein
MLFYGAEQRNKKRTNASAEHPAREYKLRDFPKRPLFMSSTGHSAVSGISKRLSFLSPLRCWFIFFAPLKTGHKHP